jgi:hypothetical protein
VGPLQTEHAKVGGIVGECGHFVEGDQATGALHAQQISQKEVFEQLLI